MIKSKKQSFIIIGLFALVLMLGTVTYAFFNYTRTGTANTIRTGRIAFNTEQGDTVTLSDLFPIENTGNITSSTPGVGTLSIHVTGDTTYESGIEYLVKAVNVTSVATGNELPISISISYEANGQGKTVGEEDEDYFDNRGGNSSIYKLLSTNTITDGGDILVGYIASGETGIDGNINIIAYLDANNIAITDTIEDGNIEVPGYTNGTDTDWINGRTVFTTEEWNALQANGVSFQIKVEANEGIWVEAPVIVPTIASCPGCKYIFTENAYYYGGDSNVNATIVSNITETISNDYRDVITNSRDFFLGFTETQDGKIDKAFACGIKNNDPNNGVAFCIEGTLNTSNGGDSSTMDAVQASNVAILNDSTTGLWRGGCGWCHSEGCNIGITCSGDDYFTVESIRWDSKRVTHYSDGCSVNGDGLIHCFIED